MLNGLVMFQQMTAPFEADSCIYSLYYNDTDVVLDEIPVMKIGDNRVSCYRAKQFYMISPAVSTQFFEPRVLGREIALGNNGVVLYSTQIDAIKRRAKEVYNERCVDASVRLMQLSNAFERLL